MKQVHGNCRKLALERENIYVQGAHHTIFATGPLVPSYATGSNITYKTSGVLSSYIAMHTCSCPSCHAPCEVIGQEWWAKYRPNFQLTECNMPQDVPLTSEESIFFYTTRSYTHKKTRSVLVIQTLDGPQQGKYRLVTSLSRGAAFHPD
jgi:hypothetical protein